MRALRGRGSGGLRPLATAQRDGGKRGLLHNFHPHHRLAMSPLGLITVEARARCLFIGTFHTFPDENTVVKTQSLIERTK